MREQSRKKIAQITLFLPLKYQELEGPISQSTPIVQRYFLTREKKAAKLTAGLWQKGDKTQGKEKKTKKPFFWFLGRTERAVRKGRVR